MPATAATRPPATAGARLRHFNEPRASRCSWVSLAFRFGFWPTTGNVKAPARRASRNGFTDMGGILRKGMYRDLTRSATAGVPPAQPITIRRFGHLVTGACDERDRKSTRLNSSHVKI